MRCVLLMANSEMFGPINSVTASINAAKVTKDPSGSSPEAHSYTANVAFLFPHGTTNNWY